MCLLALVRARKEFEPGGAKHLQFVLVTVGIESFKACCSLIGPTVSLFGLQDFNPRIHMTDSDFASITDDGTLCDSNGQLGPVRIIQFISPKFLCADLRRILSDRV